MGAATLIRISKTFVPPSFRKLAKKILHREDTAPDYQGVRTHHNMRELHEGRFAEIHDKYVQILHRRTENSFRMRAYFLCMLAKQAARTEGDFVEIGISHGIANHILYDFVDFPSLNKTCHYVDPFSGDDGHGSIKANYNTDIRKVQSQYSPDAPIRFHKAFIPQAIPLPGVEKISFCYLNTGANEAEAKTLPWLYDRMIQGSILVIDNYAVFGGNQGIFDPVLRSIGADIFTLPTGQGVIFK